MSNAEKWAMVERGDVLVAEDGEEVEFICLNCCDDDCFVGDGDMGPDAGYLKECFEDEEGAIRFKFN